MATLVNSKNSGMEILPTHRLIKEKDISIEDIKDKLVKDFTYEECDGIDQLLINMKKKASKNCTLGLFHKSSNTGLVLDFISWDALEREMPDKSKELRELDINILHSFLLKNVFVCFNSISAFSKENFELVFLRKFDFSKYLNANSSLF